MKVAGIVAEYNPFHKGHAYQIQKIREVFGEDTAVVCVMSGDFVQRGESAVFSKFARAEAAVHCGADLVLELPVHYSVASAERFAEGAVCILGNLGIVDHLVFGSESGDVERIRQTAKILLSSAFDDTVKKILESGCSYPTARSQALRSLLGEDAVSDSPNDNLGVEYVKAIIKHNFSMEPYAVKRIGAMHDQYTKDDMKSGSEIREILHTGKDIFNYVPVHAYEIYQREIRQGRSPVTVEMLETAILSRLRMLKLEDFSTLPDAAEGLERKLWKACKTSGSLNMIYDTVKSKRYTHARIRRMTMCAALGITKSDYNIDNLYARVLALNERGGNILRKAEHKKSIDIISKPAAARLLDEQKRILFEKTSDAHDLYVMAYHPDQRMGEMDWKTSPIFVKSNERM